VKSETLCTHRTRIARSLEHIQSNLDGRLDLETLARASGTSPYHFHRLFRALVGEPPNSYVRRLRLDRAAVHLLYTLRPINRIGRRAGYGTHEAFTRAFHTAFGCSPTRYRSNASLCEPSVPVELSIRRLRRRTIAFLPGVGPYDGVTGGIEQLQAWAAPKGLLEDASTLGVFRDDQEVTPPDRTRYEAALLVDDSVQPEGEVQVRSLPDCEYAVARVEGQASKDLLRPVYQHLCTRVLPARGRRLADEPNFEVYTSGPRGPETFVHVALA
jgi:AraC family transcriptional regulator